MMTRRMKKLKEEESSTTTTTDNSSDQNQLNEEEEIFLNAVSIDLKILGFYCPAHPKADLYENLAGSPVCSFCYTTVGYASQQSEFTEPKRTFSFENTKRIDFPRVCCSDHPDSEIIEDYRAGDQICASCGKVIGERVIDVSAEWRTFFHDDGWKREDRSRVGGQHDLDTIIESGVGGTKYRYLRKPTDYSLQKICQDVDETGDKLGTSQSVIDEAKRIPEMVRAKSATKTFQGHPLESLGPVSLYLASKLCDVPRSLGEISAVSNVPPKELKSKSKRIVELLKADDRIDWPKATEDADPSDYVNRIFQKLQIELKNSSSLTQLSHKTFELAIGIARKATELKMMGQRNPMTVCAASIYMAAISIRFDQEIFKDRGVILSRIESVSGMSKRTIMRAYRELKTREDELLPNQIRRRSTRTNQPRFFTGQE